MERSLPFFDLSLTELCGEERKEGKEEDGEKVSAVLIDGVMKKERKTYAIAM
jgi:hypothetical protein